MIYSIDNQPYNPPIRGYYWCDHCQQQRLDMWIDKNGNCTRCGGVVRFVKDTSTNVLIKSATNDELIQELRDRGVKLDVYNV